MKINKELIMMGIWWAVYLATTMILFEKIGITPDRVGGVPGWLVVEFVRAVVGFLIIDKIRGMLK